MAAHSEKGPSSSSRWINCTPSAKLCAEFPNESTSYAQEGTDAHELCEYLLKKELGEQMEDPRGKLTYYDQEMQEHCEDYAAYVMELVAEAKQKTKDVVVMVEQQIQYERFVKGGFGTADCIIIADGVLNVVDFKYGLGVEVKAEGNTQMQIYALGALEIFDALYDIPRCLILNTKKKFGLLLLIQHRKKICHQTTSLRRICMSVMFWIFSLTGRS